MTRLDGFDWAALAGELNASGCAQTPRLLSPAECRDIAALYDQAGPFRATIDMERYRFGSGQYRYFGYPLPGLVAELRAAFYPRLLPVARDWAARLGRPAPWPDTLDEWLEMCHAAGQRKPTPILLRYRAGDWNAFPSAQARTARLQRPWSRAGPGLGRRPGPAAPAGA